ncbi:hypothetical protein NQD34_009513 [Periophthalmus magnuspinnatus]|uniref:uncharacterized protein si:dkeyp-97b10.3 n=1 Tax=Periophthalmus magnuspinnatus TaxID=409849 RepID=UPI0022BB471A|nr:uncharacterized protein si:dkeyp-97b10.3 [Periophthalmus magnuspinnatus]KAJ0022023.1 hypothetical protein NQD34_009513 [Periophthalmus magnuspinnatus]
MVAEMASCGAATSNEDGNGDIPAPYDQDNQTETDSTSAESSSEESSEEEDNHEDRKLKSETEECSNQTTADGSAGDVLSSKANGHKEDRSPKFCCDKCKAIQQSHGKELVTPIRIAKGRLQVKLEGEGTYECTVTGLVFEASEPVVVQYSVLSWTKFGEFLTDSWRFAGPIFNVDTVNKDASVLKSIQFPHSVCLADPDSDRKFSVLHIKNQLPYIEPTVDHSGSHVKWHVTSLSPVGPIIKTSQPVEHHGVVLIYKQVAISNNCHSFHIYLATNSPSDIKDIRSQVRGYKNRYISIEKPPTCKLDEGTYRLLCEPEGEIKPQELKFTLAVTKMKGYFEAFFEQPPPFQMSLIETSTDAKVWSAIIREGDCVDPEKKPRKRTINRQRSSSPSEEETNGKKSRYEDESDGGKTTKTLAQDMSEKQLLQVAKQLGKEWKQVAIYLGLSYRDLNDIETEEKDVTMQKLKMLVEWKSRRASGQATPSHLWSSIKDLDDLPLEFIQMLEGMMDCHKQK